MRHHRFIGVVLVADCAWIPVALWVSHAFRYKQSMFDQFYLEPNSWLLVTFAISAWVLLFEFLSADGFQGGWQLPAVISRVTAAVILLMVGISSWGYLSQVYYSRLMLSYLGILLWGGFLGIRVVAYGTLRGLHRRGKTRKIVLIGSGFVARELLARIEKHPELLYEVAGFLNPLGDSPDADSDQEMNWGGLSSLEALELLKKENIREVIVATKHAPAKELQNFLVNCQEESIHVSILPQPYDLYVTRVHLLEIDGLPLVSLEEPTGSAVPKAVKRALDLVLGGVLAVMAAPLILLSGLALQIKEKRFMRKEVRCGLHGVNFEMYRLDVALQSNAPPLSAFLRRTHLSELPQLWNVLQGQMSLVGPRPDPPRRVQNYSDWQRQRLKFVPGMTGLAQVNGLRDQHESEDKARYDMQYILRWSPVFDMVLLVQTIWIVFLRLFGFSKSEPGASPADKNPSPAKTPQQGDPMPSSSTTD